MDADFIQALQAAENPEDKAALIAEASLSLFSDETARIARQCVLFHWFDQSIVEALLQTVPLDVERVQDVYKQITSLPFVEQLPWGVAYQDLTRQGLLKLYARTQPELLRSAAEIVAPLYRASVRDDRSVAEALFCSLVSGDLESNLHLDTLLEQAMNRQNWQQMEGLFRLEEEAEHISFVASLPRTEHYWMLRSIVDRVQGRLDDALIDYDHVLTINPQNALAYLNRSIVHKQQMHDEQAQADHDDALRLDPMLVQAYVDSGSLENEDALSSDTPHITPSAGHYPFYSVPPPMEYVPTQGGTTPFGQTTDLGNLSSSTPPATNQILPSSGRLQTSSQHRTRRGLLVGLTAVAAGIVASYGVIATTYRSGRIPPWLSIFSSSKPIPILCPVGSILCGDLCISIYTDTNNCGNCGNICPPDHHCDGGNCVCDSGTPCGNVCVNINSDPNNCGSCGHSCQSPTTCMSGKCHCPNAGDILCGKACVNTNSDSGNCGKCGNVCPSGATCCGGVCVNINSDPNNCGKCGIVCPPGHYCNGGNCVCNSGTSCGNVCVNINSDPGNCGGCGIVCPPDQHCNGGQCICNVGTLCGSSCVDLNSDNNNCGSCGHTCPPGQYCNGASCACISGTPCGNSCC